MTDQIKVPENINPKEFFEQLLLKQFEAAKATNPIEGMEGTEFSMQFDVDGPNGGTWSVVVKNGKDMKISAGPYDKAQITMKLSESDWRDSVTGKSGIMMDMNRQLNASRAKTQLEALKNIKGKMITLLKKPDGSVMPVTIMFNKADNPVTTIKMAVEDYVAMNEGKLDGQSAFMQGKIEIEGDMMFAMQLSQVQF
jgi:putative sterol carrier protein